MCFEGLKKTMKDLSQDSTGPAEIWTGTPRTQVRSINLQNLKQKSINMYDNLTAHTINSTRANEWEYYNNKNASNHTNLTRKLQINYYTAW
jgi:hypothetical protein